MTILLVILILFALIIVHELGHFIIAKICLVKVLEFGVGYPPTALRLGKIGDTEYTLNWIPFGGFVRLFGDEGEGQRGEGSFADASRGKQAVILFAGVLMNFLAGWLLFTGGYALGIPRLAEAPGPGVHLYISQVIPGSPADSAGIHAWDEILGMEDESGATPQALTPGAIKEYVSARGGERIILTFVRNDATSTAAMIPANAVIPEAAGQAGIGINLALVSSGSMTFAEAAKTAFSASWHAFLSVGKSIWIIISGVLTGSANIQEIVGPVGLVAVVGEASSAGLAQLLALAGFISINLAVINLVPIPALDGGRLLIIGIEAMLRRSLSKVVIHALNTVGVAAILFLMIAVTYQDIARLLA